MIKTAEVRKAAEKAGSFTAMTLIKAVDIRAYAEARRVRSIIHELKKTGEIRSVSRGVYEYVGKERTRTKMDVIWHLVRSCRQFDTSEMERLSGAARCTVTEYLLCLKRLGLLRSAGRGKWQLIKDPGPETPVNSARCKRLKSLRRAKRLQVDRLKAEGG